MLCFAYVVFIAGFAGDDVDDICGVEREIAQCWMCCTAVWIVNEFSVFVVGGVF